jgi:pimeloyl-ACP methyl ester carboxylesterase
MSAGYRAVTSAIALALAMAAAACSSGKPVGTAGGPAPSASTSPTVDASCLVGTPDAAKVVRFRSADGTPDLHEGYLTGSGTVGIVFAHMSEDDLCDWKTQADDYATKGYQALTITMSGDRFDEQVLGAVAVLRQHGATKIALVGASMGGTMVLAAAAEAQPPVQAVVSISGPDVFNDVDAGTAVTKLQVPVYYFAAQNDVEFAADAQKLYDATPEKAKTLLIVPDSAKHGTGLYPAVQDKMDQFIKANAG